MSEFMYRRIDRLKTEVEELLAAGRYGQAAEKQSDICRLIDRYLSGDVPARCRHLSTLAEIRHKLGETQAAHDLYQRARELLQAYLHRQLPQLFEEPEKPGSSESLHRTLGRYDLETAQHLNSLAMLHRHTKSDDVARTLLEKAIAIARNKLGVGHPDFAILLNNLAGVEHSAGRFEEAESLYRQTLEILRASLGAGHPEFAQSQRELARLYQDWGRPREALVLAEQAQETLRQALGEAHPALIETLDSLAALHVELGDLMTAQWHLEQARDLLQVYKAESHQESARVLHRLADVHRRMEDHEMAEALEREALSIGQHNAEEVTVSASGGLVQLETEDQLDQPCEAKRARRPFSLLE